MRKIVNLISSDDYDLRSISEVDEGDGLDYNYVAYLDPAIQLNQLVIMRSEIAPIDLQSCTDQYQFRGGSYCDHDTQL